MGHSKPREDKGCCFLYFVVACRVVWNEAVVSNSNDVAIGIKISCHFLLNTYMVLHVNGKYTDCVFSLTEMTVMVIQVELGK